MKKLVLALISLICVNVVFAKKVQTDESVQYLNGGGVKFHIEDKVLPKSPLKQISGQQCWEKILQECGVKAQEYNIKTHSVPNSKLVCFDRNACFEGFLTAFDKHYSLVLSPDIIWLLISQGIATQINDNAEKLRDRLVDFEGQRTLKIETYRDLLEHEEDWNWIIPAFSDSIDRNMKAKFSDLMVCSFSTTGLVERISSQITMMESVKKFFKYEVHLMGCGIPDITLLGTPDDWKDIRSRIARLDDLDLEWWRKKLEPVLDEFVNASEGNINRKFWLDMIQQYAPEKRTQAFCGSSGIIPAEYNGWFTVFFPFCKDERTDAVTRTPQIVTHNTKVCSEVKKVDVLYVIHLVDHEVTFNLELWAGFIGMEMDWESRSLKPVISWMMRVKSDSEMTLSKLDPEDISILKSMGEFGMINDRSSTVIGFYGSYSGQTSLLACKFPSTSMSANYGRVDKNCKSYTLVSLKEISVPSDLGKWCQKNHIENVTVKAPMSDEQKEDILRQFPAAVVVQL